MALSHYHCFRVAEAGVLQLTAAHVEFGAFKREIQALVVGSQFLRARTLFLAKIDKEKSIHLMDVNQHGT